MAIPKYDEMILPVLRILGDGAEHSQHELGEKVADYFRLTPQAYTASQYVSERPATLGN